MAFVYANPNPHRERVGDCTVRAISLATGKPWREVYVALCGYGYKLCDMPSSNAVWGEYLSDLGYVRDIASRTCPMCTIAEFAEQNNKGVYILGTGTHVVCVRDGDYYDAWDSGDETPIFAWREKDA